ncbi:PREDICTED: regulator of microtubule dynamics protein 1-like [Polistes dominula]|uniref:Regulator of microtubule dynamics protein 1 n=1 Tax=Polistes dominula TaxID=743375 RepID=A0ABM1IWB2_POLDO|nr:PREDICTED: regulator of microtubule dynamics protein 1-like [Polistes dominula]XP_015184499.1 PREDICTED: regulator of microtubule dynamics protein 1-like [Polistes dominula]
MSNLESKALIAAAIGVTVGVISVAGMFFYQQFLNKQKYQAGNNSLEPVYQSLAKLQKEVEALRQQQKRKKRSTSLNRKNTLSSNDNTYVSTENDLDSYSTAGTDIADDEFFDCSDVEDGTEDIESRESTSINQLETELMTIDAQDRTEEQNECTTYYKLKELIELHPHNVGVIWRFARACYSCISNFTDVEHKTEIISEGLKACERVIDVEDADLHKWYAILIGTHGEYLPTAEKIKNGTVFKNHVMIALKIRPKDPSLHHLLGRFQFELSGLSWFEKKLASTFFAEPPNASYDEAIESFEQAEELATVPHLENRLFLSKAYIAKSNFKKAVHLLDDICQQSVVTKEEQNVQSEAKKLLETHSKYL